MTLILLVVHAILAATAIVISVLAIQAKTAARARMMATLLLGTVGVQTLVGDALYPIYLSHAKPVLRTLAAGQRSVADIFEVKEHLAFFALVFTIGAFVLTRNESKPTALLRVLFTCAHGAIILAAALGLVVASVRTP